MATKIHKVDCLIIGAGLVGSTLANLLGRLMPGNNFTIGVVESTTFQPGYSASHFDPRVVALTWQSRKLLEQAGVWKAVAESRCCPFRHMEVRDSDGTGKIEFHASEVGQPCLGHIVENSIIVEQLLAQCAALDNIQMFCPARLETIEAKLHSDGRQGYLAILDTGQQIETDLLVGADGARSIVRELAGFRVREWSYQQDAIVTTIVTEQPHNFTARQWFHSTGPLAFLPLHGVPEFEDRACSIVWSQDCSAAEQIMTLDDRAFCEKLTRASEQTLGKVVQTDRRFRIPLNQRHAIDYVRPGLVLVGDAAHNIHPLAGQGVNLGFQDIEVLLEELQRAIRKQLPLGSELVLMRYQRRRKAENLRMMAVMEGFKRLFGSNEVPLRVLRNEGMTQLDRMMPIKQTIIREVMGLG